MIAMKEVKSSAMDSWGYDPAGCILAIKFSSGHVAHYSDVPQEIADKFEKHESKGRAVGQLLRDQFKHTLVLDECEA